MTPSGSRSLDSGGAETLRAAVASDAARSAARTSSSLTVRRIGHRRFERSQRSRLQRRATQKAAIHRRLSAADSHRNSNRSFQRRRRGERQFGNVIGGYERNQQLDKTPFELTSIVQDRKRSNDQTPRLRLPAHKQNQPRSLGGSNRSTQDSDTERTRQRSPRASLTWTEITGLGLERPGGSVIRKSTSNSSSSPKERSEARLIRNGRTLPRKSIIRKTRETEKIKAFVTRLIYRDVVGGCYLGNDGTLNRRCTPAGVPDDGDGSRHRQSMGRSLALRCCSVGFADAQSMPASSGPAPQANALDKLMQAVQPPEPEEPKEVVLPKTCRDSLQELVAADPAAAASVLAKMIQKA